MKYTKEQIEEYIKCRDDIEYFANNYIKINTVINGVEQITLNQTQIEMINAFKNEQVWYRNYRRQSGKTTGAAIILLHHSIFNAYKTSAIAGYKFVHTNEMLSKIVDMHNHLPEFLQCGFEKLNKNQIIFYNGSTIKSIGSNPDNVKGMNISILYIDESDFVSNVEEMIRCVYPCIGFSNDGKIFAVSSSFSRQFLDFPGLLEM